MRIYKLFYHEGSKIQRCTKHSSIVEFLKLRGKMTCIFTFANLVVSALGTEEGVTLGTKLGKIVGVNVGSKVGLKVG